MGSNVKNSKCCWLLPALLLSFSLIASSGSRSRSYQRHDDNESFHELQHHLRYALKKGNVAAVEALLNQGVSPSQRLPGGLTPLLIASYYGQTACVKKLLERGANFLIGWDSNLVPYHGVGLVPYAVAFLRGYADCAELFSAQEACSQSVNLDSWRRLHLAALCGDSTRVSELLNRGVSTINRTNEGYTPLHLAAIGGSLRCLKALYAQNSRVASRHRRMMRLLHCAAWSGSIKCVRFCLDKKCDPEATTKRRYRPLHYAARHGTAKMVQLLLDRGVEVDPLTVGKISPLHLAARQGDRESMELLISKGADLQRVTSDKRTLLHFAALGGSCECIQVCLDNRLDLEARTEDRWKPLHFATMSGSSQAVALLLKKGAAVDSSGGKNWETPLHTAARKGNIECMHILVKNGARIDTSLIFGSTILHDAVMSGSLECVEFCLDQGAYIAEENRYDEHPLHLAAWFPTSSAAIVKTLIDHGAFIEARGGLWMVEPALEKALRQNYTERVHVLLQAGAHLGRCASTGGTLLEKALTSCSDDIVKLVIRYSYLAYRPPYDEVESSIQYISEAFAMFSRYRSHYCQLGIMGMYPQIYILTALPDLSDDLARVMLCELNRVSKYSLVGFTNLSEEDLHVVLQMEEAREAVVAYLVKKLTNVCEVLSKTHFIQFYPLVRIDAKRQALLSSDSFKETFERSIREGINERFTYLEKHAPPRVREDEPVGDVSERRHRWFRRAQCHLL